MGQEGRCIARLGNATSEGKALLESDELIFRGDFRLRIRFADVSSVEARDGTLIVVLPEGTASFELGAKADRWAERIRNPPTLLDKLGVKPGMRVSLLGMDDERFRALLRERTADVADEEPGADSDLIFLQVAAKADLAGIAELERYLKRDGGIWVLAPRGRDDPKEVDVLEAGRAAGLVDTKVARFSETHTAHRFAIPRDRRGSRARRVSPAVRPTRTA